MGCLVFQLGRIGYEESYRLQHRFRRLRILEAIPDILFLLEHPPTLTVGKAGRTGNILVPLEYLRWQRISLFFTDRGGDVTYHGPGQLTAYPIVSLKSRGKDVHRYVHNLEEVIIRTLKEFAITGERDEYHPGVWIGREEIAAVGLSFKNWVSMHGLGLNVNPDLTHFSLINPCGLMERTATSMTRVLDREIPLEAVMPCFIGHFSEVFETGMEIRKCSELGEYYEESLSALDQMESA